MHTLFKIITLMTLAVSMTACSAKDMDKEDNSVEKAEVYVLKREWKRVIRYNCQDQVTSDEIETILPPRQLVSITPTTSENYFRPYFKNLNNNSTPAIAYGEHKFTIDMAPTILNMQVQEGINQISYQFEYCDERKFDTEGHPIWECAVPVEIREEGSIFINVSYEQTWLEGFNEVKPTYQDCHPQPTPTPSL